MNATKGRLHLTILAQEWRPATRADCLTAEQKREELLETLNERAKSGDPVPAWEVERLVEAASVDGDNCQRPCVFVTCRHHLLTDIATDGRLLKSHAFDERDDQSIADTLRNMAETCSIDAGAVARTQVAVAQMMGIGQPLVSMLESAGILAARRCKAS